MNGLRVTVHKADGTVRGDGWYFLVNGVKDGRILQDVGGDDWYSSEKLAREAGKRFAERCAYNPRYGWCVRSADEKGCYAK